MVAAVTTGMVLAAGGGGAAVAGEPGDDPEYPYPATTYQEPNRGQFHFSSRAGWLNDVNAPVYYRGTWHLYYQHNPHGLAWNTMHWGHATSTDLVHWQQKPIALEPGVHPGDLWSGGGVVDKKNASGLSADNGEDPIVVYSGTNGVQVFVSTDGGTTFQTYDGGRKVVTMPGTSRDPQVFWDQASKAWIMTVWSDEGGNGVNFYRSSNLLDWDFTSRFAADWLFECPQLLPMTVEGTGETRFVLNDASGEYLVGDFDGRTFSTTQGTPARFNNNASGAGGEYYAGLAFENAPGGRTVSMAWQGGNSGSTWTGNFTVPVDMTLRATADGPRVQSTPVPELDALRTATHDLGARTLTGDQAATALSGVSVDQADLRAVIDVRATKSRYTTFRLHTGANHWADREVVYDKRLQTLDGQSLPTRADGTVSIRMLVDRGQLEIYGNDGAYYRSLNTSFDSLPGGPGVALEARQGVVLRSLVVHELGSAWNSGEAMLRTNIKAPWYAASGQWTDVAGGKQGTSGGDAFYLSTRKGSDFVYEGDVTIVSGTAAALTFRSDARATRHYTVNIDADAGVVKLWRPGRDIATFATPVERGRAHHLKVQAVGDHFQVWLDDAPDPVIDARDDTISNGQFGLNLFRGTAVMQDVMVSKPPAGLGG